MSEFECYVRDLNGKQEETEEKISTQSPTGILSKDNQKEYNNALMYELSDINGSLFAKISEKKNVKIILIIIVTYLITNSSQFIEFLGNSLPYLAESGVTNLSGKVVIAILIGLSVVIFTSFF